MGLFTFDTSGESGEKYLGTTIQDRLKPLKEQKLALVQTKLGIQTIKRPDISLCDISDRESIIRFLARENLECAFNCDPDTPIERVDELCAIITEGIFPSGKHIHIIPHANTDIAAREKNSSDMFGYFEVWLRDSPQIETELQTSLTRFRTFFLQTTGSSTL